MVQRSLIPIETCGDPLRGYVPVLQDHSGERTALAALRATAPEMFDAVTPVIAIVGRKKTELSQETVKAHVQRIAQVASADRWFYLDFLRSDPARMLETPQGRVATSGVAYEAARKRGLAFIPVVGTDARTAHVNAAANAAILDGRGIALRHRLRGRANPTGGSLSELLRTSLTSLQLSTEEVDLMLDLEYLDPDIEVRPERFARIVEQCLAVGSWRRIVLLGSSIPTTLSCVPEGQNGFIERQEWLLWNALPTEVRKLVDFGDYGIQHPTPPKDSGPGMRANIRYTLAERHLVVRGRGEVRVEGAAQYVGLCGRLVDSGHFAGSSYSWGDECIKRCSVGSLPPGDQTLWRAVGTAHHIRFVSEQLRARG